MGARISVQVLVRLILDRLITYLFCLMNCLNKGFFKKIWCSDYAASRLKNNVTLGASTALSTSFVEKF